MRPSSLALAALLAGGVALWLSLGPDGDASAAADGVEGSEAVSAEGAAAIPVVLARSEAEPFTLSRRHRAVTEAARRVSVMAETSGLIIDPPLRAGAMVAAGEALCKIAPGDRPALLARAEADLARAEADLAASAALETRGFAAAVKVAADRAAVASAEADLAAAQLDLERTTVLAPFAGRLETDAAELGSYLQPGAVCAEIIALDPIKIVAFAPETALTALSVGAKAEVRFADGATLEAALTFIGAAADAATRTYRVEATAANPDWSIRDGAPAILDVRLPAGAAHRTPHSALTLNDAGTLGVRLAVGDANGALRSLFFEAQVLSDDRDGVWIAGPADAPLPDTAHIIIQGQEFAADGARLAPVDAEAAQ